MRRPVTILADGEGVSSTLWLLLGVRNDFDFYRSSLSDLTLLSS
jgi:hypothetical protein